MSFASAPLRDLCESVSYGYTASATHEAIGPRFLRITDIVPDTIDWESVPYCSIESRRVGKYLLSQGDIVVARTGATTGFAKRIRGKVSSVFASYLVRFRIGRDADPAYVGFVVESDAYKAYVRQHMGGAAQPNANAQVLGSFPVPLPPLPIQRKIASVLSAYDDLIENNNRRIKILEEMAQNLYREWFVKFRFPGHENTRMVDSPLGAIPEGWEVAAVKGLLKRLKQTASYTQENVLAEGAVPVIDQSTAEVLGYHEGEADFVARESNPVIIFGDHTCKMQLMTEPFSVGPNVVPFISGRADIHVAYLYYLVRSLVETHEYKRHWSELNSKTVCVAQPQPSAEFAGQIRPLLSMQRVLGRGNAVLRRQRDLLLPKLVSGEVDAVTCEAVAEHGQGSLDGAI